MTIKLVLPLLVGWGLLKHFVINLTSAVVTAHSMTSLRKTPFQPAPQASLPPSVTEALSHCVPTFVACWKQSEYRTVILPAISKSTFMSPLPAVNSPVPAVNSPVPAVNSPVPPVNSRASTINTQKLLYKFVCVAAASTAVCFNTFLTNRYNCGLFLFLGQFHDSKYQN